MTLTSKDRAELRAEAHHLAALVRVGQQGLSTTVIDALRDVLRTHELVKVQLGRRAEASPREAAEALAAATGADIVQIIGRTATFYLENPDLERRKGAPPPWRR
jgi:RNA-binding protein